MAPAPVLLQMSPDDNVAIVGNAGGLPLGAVLPDGTTLIDAVPQAHKVTLSAIAQGEPVRRYGVVIGYATQDLAAGRWVHDRLLSMPAAPGLTDLPKATRTAATGAAMQVPDTVARATFMGYRNPDGSVGTRNLLGITTTVQCVAGVLANAMTRITHELLPKYPNVDGAVARDHAYGCGVAIDAPDAIIPIRTVRNISLNPNFGGELMVVSLGCEKLQPERLLPLGSIPVAAVSDGACEVPGLDVVRLQDNQHVGFQAMIQAIVDAADRHLQRLNTRRREPVPISELVVGVQCGGSDALSGVTANPLVGCVTDWLVGAGATVMFSVNTAVRDAVDQHSGGAGTGTSGADPPRSSHE